MTEFFLQTVNLSYRVSFLILVIFLLRLLLKKAPKWVSVALWGIAAVRLLVPFSLESVFSMMPSGNLVAPEIMLDPTPTIQSGIPAVNDVVNPILQNTFAPAPGDSMNPLQLWLPLAAAIWVAGFAAMVLYTFISYWDLKRKVSDSMQIRDRIFRGQSVPSPFVLGILRPRIYLPGGISETDETFVIAHEEAHIRRHDHWWKPFGFLLLSIHWFNPLMWLGYVFLCRDIELACDEKVIKALGEEAKADYSQALLNCSVSRKRIAACPLAFGEVGVKQRIKSVLHYKKPAFWILIVAIVISIVAAVCFLTDPIKEHSTPTDPNPGITVPATSDPETIPSTEAPTAPSLEGLVTLFDKDTDWSVSVGSQVPGKTDITVQLDRYSAGITHTDGTITTILSGMPIWNAYFSDLNGDGVSELCAGTSFGSGMVDDRILVYDFVSGKRYELESRGDYDYQLTHENGALVVTVYPYRTKNIAGKGPLVLAKDGDIYRLTYREYSVADSAPLP